LFAFSSSVNRIYRCCFFLGLCDITHFYTCCQNLS
jgi:hypothetical protein